MIKSSPIVRSPVVFAIGLVAMLSILALGVAAGSAKGPLALIVALHAAVVFLTVRSSDDPSVANLTGLLAMGGFLYGTYMPIAVILGAEPSAFAIMGVRLDATNVTLGSLAFLLAALGLLATVVLSRRVLEAFGRSGAAFLVKTFPSRPLPGTALAAASLVVVFVSLSLLYRRLGDSRDYSDMHASLRGLGGLLAFGVLLAQLGMAAHIAAFARTRQQRFLLLAGLTALLPLFATFATGARNHAVNTAIVATVVISLRVRRILISTLLFVFVIGYFPTQLGVGLRYLREHGDQLSYSRLVEVTPLLLNDLSAVFQVSAVVVDHAQTGFLPPLKGRSYVDAFGRSLPYLVYPDRPPSAAERFAFYVGERIRLPEGNAFAMPYCAEGYWNFGWAGVIVASMLVGLAFQWLNLACRHAAHSEGVIVLTSVVAPHALWAARADVASMLLRLGVLTLLAAFVVAIALRILTPSRQ